MRKLAVLISVLALASFGFAACGGDDDDDSSTEAATTESTTTEAGGGGGGSTVALEADSGGALAFAETSLSASAGSITIDFDNPASTGHDVCVESPSGDDLGCSDTVTGDSTSVTVDATDPGDYTYYCSVDGHREAGMEGTLTVK
jgi:plastocyanin